MITRAEAEELRILYQTGKSAAVSHAIVSTRTGRRNETTLAEILKWDAAFNAKLASLTEPTAETAAPLKGGGMITVSTAAPPADPPRPARP